MALVKLPCMAFKVYMFCFLQRSGLLLVSLLWDVILNGVKTYKIVSHVRTARKYKSWLADPERSDVTLSAKTVREKLLKKHFFFQESQTTGKLQDPGLWLGCGHVIAAFYQCIYSLRLLALFCCWAYRNNRSPEERVDICGYIDIYIYIHIYKRYIYIYRIWYACQPQPLWFFKQCFKPIWVTWPKFEVGLVLANLWWPMLCPRTTKSHRLFGSLDNSWRLSKRRRRPSIWLGTTIYQTEVDWASRE